MPKQMAYQAQGQRRVVKPSVQVSRMAPNPFPGAMGTLGSASSRRVVTCVSVSSQISQAVLLPVAAPQTCVVQCIRQPVLYTQARPVVMLPHPAVHPAAQVRRYEDSLSLVRKGLTELPVELLQEIINWLPTFRTRCRARALCRSARGLEWRQAAPLHVEEELSCFGLGDIGVLAITAGLRTPRNITLKELCLGANGITDVGAEALAAVLAEGRTRLHRLSLRDNAIGDRGAEALAAALATNSTLEELDLWGNRISEKGRQALISASRCEVFLELPRPSRPYPRPPGGLSLEPRARAVLFDWISQVHTGIATAVETAPDPQEMLFRAFGHMDAYIALRPVRRADLQLIGLACTLVATRLEANKEDPPECMELASWLAFVTDGACTAQEVREMAREVRSLLGSKLHQPTVYTFLRRYLRQTGWTEGSFSLANYLAELAALDSSFREFRPQAVAAAAAILSRQYQSQGVDVHSMPRWKTRLLRAASVDLQQELAPCAAALSRLHAAQPSSRSAFVQKKYEWPRLHTVARLKANPPSDATFFATYLVSDLTES